jgi:hypothetical protein
MTEVETIAGSTPNGVKPYSPDENAGAPDMSRVPPTPVAGVAPRPAFGASDPDAASISQGAGNTTMTSAPFRPTPFDAAPTKTVDLAGSDDGAKNVENQDKASDQARKDEASKDDGPDFGAIKERSRADEENRNRDLRAQGALDARNNPARSNETDAIAPQGAQIGGAAARSLAPVDNHGAGYGEPQATVGRIVQYTLTQADADRINTRRVYGAKGEDGSGIEEGASVQAGVVYPAIITSVGDGKLNLHVFADGNHGVWVQNATQGADGGTWAWPVVR